ncbi:hypothetical protein [Streptomyces auratus]|uniref:Uncharacterized protein n=1 Tax=Streptomyces auratus AGR0001 TaxID=1160718 RepID=J1RNX3_9ACTN|nr:hypothetical protein [Streptomyces auratus]QTZ92842.1 hypothetical protein SU9_016280 [Streptomyces auratus AGR0001]
MTTDDAAPPEQHTVQNNYGGAFVGRDQYGDININHELDPQTKATLAKLGKSAPALSQMLEDALRDGVISPDTVSQLSLAARSINEDVAGQISRASHRINEDVAGLLTHASHSINEDVAGQLTHAADRLSKASAKLDFDALDLLVRRLEGVLGHHEGSDLNGLATRLENSLEDLSTATHQVGNLKGDNTQTVRLEQVTKSLTDIAKRVEARVTPPPPVVLPDWEGRWRWFGVGVLLGILISVLYAAYS